jgi:hypothetical protein
VQLVPAPGPAEQYVRARLSNLDSLTEHLGDDERLAFRQRLVAALCAVVSDEEWAAAVSLTIERFNAWSRAEQLAERSSNLDDRRS